MRATRSRFEIMCHKYTLRLTSSIQHCGRYRDVQKLDMRRDEAVLPSAAKYFGGACVAKK